MSRNVTSALAATQATVNTAPKKLKTCLFSLLTKTSLLRSPLIFEDRFVVSCESPLLQKLQKSKNEFSLLMSNCNFVKKSNPFCLNQRDVPELAWRKPLIFLLLSMIKLRVRFPCTFF